MPYVFVTRRPSKISSAMLRMIKVDIRRIVARNLDTPQHPLSEVDIEVFFSEFDPEDLTSRDLRVIVQATSYHDRLALDLDEVARTISREVHESTASGIRRIATWIQLTPGGFFSSKG